MKSHPRAGVDMLDGSQWSPLVKAVVLRHHERWNGSGYPDGRVGEEIHQMARIAAVADVYDAITSERLYAPARPASEGVRAIMEGSGTLFDPDVVDAFCRVVAPVSPGDRGRAHRRPHRDRRERARRARSTARWSGSSMVPGHRLRSRCCSSRTSASSAGASSRGAQAAAA